MKSVKLLVFLFGVLLFASMVSALTTINLKTLPYQDLYITPIKAGGGFEALAQPQFFSADEYGDLMVQFEDFSVSPFEVFVSLKNSEGITIHRATSSERFVTGTEISFIAAPNETQLVYAPGVNLSEEEPEPVLVDEVNDSLNETNFINETNSSLNSTGLSGGVVDKTSTSKFSIQKLIFILAAFVLLIIIYLVVKEESDSKNFKKFGGKMHFLNHKKKKPALGKGLEETKGELREAKQRVESLKKKEKIEEVRVRLKKDEEALDRLEEEEDKKSK